EEFEDIEELPDQDVRPKILITGANGQLGHDLTEILKKDYNVMAVSRNEMDVQKPEEVIATFTLFEPNIVIHPAAYTKVDACEEDPEKAFRVNAMGTQNLALACEEFGSLMVYISTDYVFDGTKGSPYREYDRPNPINVYGESKLMGEEYVKQLLVRHFIIRTSWLVGKKGGNFVKSIVRLAREREELTVVDDQFGRPTFTNDLASAIRQLIETPYYGLYHVTNQGETNWFQFAEEIVRLAGLSSRTLVRPQRSTELNRPAKRPAYSVLDDFIWRVRGFRPMRDWKEALGEYLQDKDVKRELEL
ncbi:MAG TPA: dTDP-4-dehydrorhamnose reductase, partial [bacterium]|nr:dTDP-4-dehydrorhamnose reductase [bacterium]